MDNGLTGDEAGEVLGHLAFYTGWPNSFSAAPVVKERHREATMITRRAS
jgi:4-carboxymuconolactone decarboxylase